jgi:hypothetical protein
MDASVDSVYARKGSDLCVTIIKVSTPSLVSQQCHSLHLKSPCVIRAKYKLAIMFSRGNVVSWLEIGWWTSEYTKLLID